MAANSKQTVGEYTNVNTRKDQSDYLVELIEALRSAPLEDPLAKLNETTISDNNGGRIEL